MCEFLLLNGADPEVRDNQGMNAFIWAVISGHFTTALVIRSFFKTHKSAIDFFPRKKDDGSLKKITLDQLSKLPLRHTTGIHAFDHSRKSALKYVIDLKPSDVKFRFAQKMVNMLVFFGAELGTDVLDVYKIHKYPVLRDAFADFAVTVKKQRVQYAKTPLFTLQSFAYFFPNLDNEMASGILNRTFLNFMVKYQ